MKADIVSFTTLFQWRFGHYLRISTTLRVTERGIQARNMVTMRSTSLCIIQIDHFVKICIRRVTVIKITDILGSMDGSAKTSQGGWNKVGEHALEVYVCYESCNDEMFSMTSLSTWRYGRMLQGLWNVMFRPSTRIQPDWKRLSDPTLLREIFYGHCQVCL